MEEITNTRKNVLTIMAMVEGSDVSFDHTHFFHVELVVPELGDEWEKFKLYGREMCGFFTVNRIDRIMDGLDGNDNCFVFGRTKFWSH